MGGALEFPRETGLILRFAVKVGNPLQTKQGNRPTGHHQEGRRGLNEVVPVFEKDCRKGIRVSVSVGFGKSAKSVMNWFSVPIWRL